MILRLFYLLNTQGSGDEESTTSHLEDWSKDLASFNRLNALVVPSESIIAVDKMESSKFGWRLQNKNHNENI